MYTIKQAAQRSGVSVALLRAWERRYHVVEPARTATGYRLYDDQAIERLRAMRALVNDGWTPSNAAAHVVDLDANAVAQLAVTTVAKPTVEAPPAAAEAADDRHGEAGPEAVEIMEKFIAAAATLDEPAMEAMLDDMFMRGSYERVTSEMVMPALVALGERWAAGQLDVAAEHAAAAAVQRRLGAAFMAAGRPTHEAGAVLVGMPPGSRHELGALAFATAARRAGVPVRYLGADLPVENWIEAAVLTSASAAVIGAVVPADTGPAQRVARGLLAARPEMLVAFGGSAADAVHITDEAHELRLPTGLAESVALLSAAIARSA